ncbi:MAG: hypothetical protein ACRDTG_28500 [Pseudonocardiaceae bacterium]
MTTTPAPTGAPDRPTFDHDCPTCEIAGEIVDALADQWDPHDNWSEVQAIGWPVGWTMRQQALELVTRTLHARDES